MAGGANHSRLTQMSYGWNFEFLYGASGAVNDRISRLDEVEAMSSEWVELFAYLGLGTMVKREFNANNLTLTYVGTGTGDGGDKYVGLDRFGRIDDQRWVEGSTVIVDYAYGYDRDSNRLYQQDQVNTAMSELYAYDNLNQLTGFQRGTLNSTHDAITGTVARSQSWSPDAAGNFSSVSTNGTAATWTANRQNEVTAAGSASPAYDANGNTTTDDQGHTLIFDPWNRLVGAKSGSTYIAGYSYDALSRRITETHAGGTTFMLVSAADQVLVEGEGDGFTTYFWDPTAVDAPVFRDAYTPSSETQVYALTTATGDVACIVTSLGGAVAERYAYDPYGQVTGQVRVERAPDVERVDARRQPAGPFQAEVGQGQGGDRNVP